MTSVSPQEASAMFVPVKETEILSKMTTNGLQVRYRYTRAPHLYSSSMTAIQLTINNMGQDDLSDVKIGSKSLASGMSMHEFPSIANLPSGVTQTVTIGINFNDSTQSAKFDFVANGRVFTVQLQPIVGELVRAMSVPESVFEQERAKLRGMNEVEVKFDIPSAASDEATIKKRVYETANVMQVPSLESGSLKFAGTTVANKSWVLMNLKHLEGKATLTVNCEKIVIGSMLAKEIRQSLESSMT